MVDGQKIHLCGLTHHDTAKWIQDIRHEIDHAVRDRQDYVILTSKFPFELKKVYV